MRGEVVNGNGCDDSLSIRPEPHRRLLTDSRDCNRSCICVRLDSGTGQAQAITFDGSMHAVHA